MKTHTLLIALLPVFVVPAMATTFVAQYSPSSALNTAVSGAPKPSAGSPPGLYVQVIDGLINVTNGGGVQQFSAGQFGYTANFQMPPVLVPKSPAPQFTPPPAFSSTTGSSSAANPTKSNSVDCEVR